MPGKSLVVDACVARSAGTASDAPVSTHSRAALTAIKEHTEHVLVFNSALSQEWREHAGRLASSILTYLIQRRRVHFIDDAAFAGVLRGCAHLFNDESEKAAFVKDAHVVAAALASDRIIVSKEVRLREQLVRVSADRQEVGGIIWSSPALEGEQCARWISEGANRSPERRIAVTPP